mmetsp:Transcript_16139/g.34062  ORF Transcript_16139/g.34062 Transcript_16139/m.34062 type:complete len:455 (+) Transcript_16139:463-1827(+)
MQGNHRQRLGEPRPVRQVLARRASAFHLHAVLGQDGLERRHRQRKGDRRRDHGLGVRLLLLLQNLRLRLNDRRVVRGALLLDHLLDVGDGVGDGPAGRDGVDELVRHHFVHVAGEGGEGILDAPHDLGIGFVGIAGVAAKVVAIAVGCVRRRQRLQRRHRGILLVQLHTGEDGVPLPRKRLEEIVHEGFVAGRRRRSHDGRRRSRRRGGEVGEGSPHEEGVHAQVGGGGVPVGHDGQIVHHAGVPLRRWDRLDRWDWSVVELFALVPRPFRRAHPGSGGDHRRRRRRRSPILVFLDGNLLNHVRQLVDVPGHGGYPLLQFLHLRLEVGHLLRLLVRPRRRGEDGGGGEDRGGGSLGTRRGGRCGGGGGRGRRGGRALDFREEVLPTPSEFVVAEPPELGRLGLQFVVDFEGVGELDFAEPVEVQLSHERAEFIVLEELRNDRRLEERRILYYKG